MDDYNAIMLAKAQLLKHTKEVCDDPTVIRLVDGAFDMGVSAAIGPAKMFIEYQNSCDKMGLRLPLEDLDLSDLKK